jgi:hypothetical protein
MARLLTTALFLLSLRSLVSSAKKAALNGAPRRTGPGVGTFKVKRLKAVTSSQRLEQAEQRDEDSAVCLCSSGVSKWRYVSQEATSEALNTVVLWTSGNVSSGVSKSAPTSTCSVADQTSLPRGTELSKDDLNSERGDLQSSAFFYSHRWSTF